MTNPERILVSRDETKPRFDPWKLRVWREARGLTQRELADKMGLGKLGYQEVSKFETYALAVGPVTLQRLAGALDVREEALLSNGDKWRENKGKFNAWVADGRPRIARWLKDRGL